MAETKPHGTRNTLIGIAALSGLAVWSATGDNKKRAEPTCDKAMAFVMSQGFIEKRLKAPASASFPWMSAEGVAIRDLGDCEFRVRAYVDAQNSFGANIRTWYSMNLRYQKSDETWHASNIHTE